MKKYSFTISIYDDMKITFVQIESAEDMKKVERECRRFGVCESDIDEIRDAVERGLTNGGQVFRDMEKRQMLVVFELFNDDEEMACCYMHEKRHIEDRILEFFRVDDIESNALLAGYVGKHLYRFWKIVKG